MSQHAELIARLEAAEVVTHALEVEFATHLYENQETFKGLVNYDPELWVERNGTPLKSMDAALALAERVLPGVDWRLSAGQGWKPMAELWPASERLTILREAIVGQAKTPELAFCAAILRALGAKA